MKDTTERRNTDLGEDANELYRPFTNYVSAQSNETCSTVIIGAGIIGCATAYYLSRSPSTTRPDSIHLVEANEELFASASGKAGGFVAEDWFGPATASLGELSFSLHEELAAEHDNGKEWGYSRSTGTSLVDGGSSSSKSSKGANWLERGGSRAEAATAVHEYHSGSNPGWLRKRKGDQVQAMTDEGGVAQVDPLRLSQFLLKQSLLAGVRLHHPVRPLRVAIDGEGKLSGLRIAHSNGSEHKIPCTRLLITAGAWTPGVFSALFPSSSMSIPVSSYAGHSLVLKSPRWTEAQESKGCHAIFSTMRSGFSPEIFSRMGEEIYIAGLNSSAIPLPELPGHAKIDPESIKELLAVAESLLGEDDLQVKREGLCFRPVTRSGNPILAKVEDRDLGTAEEISTLPESDGGVFVCAGHGPWGISHSLGTGKVMSEMLEGVRTSADIRRLGIH